MIGPEVVTLATAGVGAITAAVGGWQARRRALADADRLATGVLEHPAFGLPAGDPRAPIVGAPLHEISDAPLPVTGPVVTASVTSLPANAELDTGTCHGRLTRHQDGHLTCHGGRWDCHPDLESGTRYRHGPVVDCRTIDHGCGRCDSVRGMGLDPDPPQEADTSCARGCGRPGEVWVAASGSLPTMVCQRCADAIALRRTHGVCDTTRQEGYR